MIERAQQICDRMNLILSSWHDGSSLSMGVAISDADAHTFMRLYENADKALYEAKKTSRSKLVIFQKEGGSVSGGHKGNM